MDKLKDNQNIIGGIFAVIITLATWSYMLTTWSYDVDIHLDDPTIHLDPASKKFVDRVFDEQIERVERNARIELRLEQLEKSLKCSDATGE